MKGVLPYLIKRLPHSTLARMPDQLPTCQSSCRPITSPKKRGNMPSANLYKPYSVAMSVVAIIQTKVIQRFPQVLTIISINHRQIMGNSSRSCWPSLSTQTWHRLWSCRALTSNEPVVVNNNNRKITWVKVAARLWCLHNQCPKIRGAKPGQGREASNLC